MIDALHFLRPWWFLALIPCLLAVLALIFFQRQRNGWQGVCDPHLLPHLLQERVRKSPRFPLAFLAIAWLFAIIALAGPSWSQLPEPIYRSLAADVFVVDLSTTMLASDIKPTRLDRMRYKLLDILQADRDTAVGMVAYAGEAYVVSPITEDANTLASMVPSLTPAIMPTDGNNLAMALEKAHALIAQAQVSPANIIVITSSTPDALAISTAKQLANKGIRVSVLGMGTEQGSPITLANGNFLQDNEGNVIMSRLDASTLQALAQAGKGQSIGFTSDNTDAKKIWALTPLATALEAKQEKGKFNRWQDQGRWFLGLTLLLALLAFRKGWFDEVLR